MSRVCQNPACQRPLPPEGPYRERKWCSDKCRKTQYIGTCPDCGGPTSGLRSGVERAPERCLACARARQYAERRWTQDTIIAAIQRWAADTGYPPSATDWLLDRKALPPGEWPPIGCVQREFGSWAEAIRQAGYTPGLWRRQSAADAALRYLLDHSTATAAEIANAAGMARNAINHGLTRLERDGRVIRLGRARLGRAGNQAIVWTVAADQEEAA